MHKMDYREIGVLSRNLQKCEKQILGMKF